MRQEETYAEEKGANEKWYNLQTLFVQIEKFAKVFLFVLNVFKILLLFLHLHKNVFCENTFK